MAIKSDSPFGGFSLLTALFFRVAAKKTKNFAEADRIRKELLEAGVVLEDTPQSTTWRRV